MPGREKSGAGWPSSSVNAMCGSPSWMANGKWKMANGNALPLHLPFTILHLPSVRRFLIRPGDGFDGARSRDVGPDGVGDLDFPLRRAGELMDEAAVDAADQADG